MRLFWKIFFSTMLVSVACFALGGYVLIQSSFSSQLKQETEAAYSQNEVVAYALAGEIVADASRLLEKWGEDSMSVALGVTAKDVGIFLSGTQLQFALFDQDKAVLYTAFPEGSLLQMLLDQASDSQRGHVIVPTKGKYLIQAIIPMQLGGETYYIATQKDVTSIFENQKQQLHLLLLVMCGMLLVAGTMTYFIIRFLLRRIYHLTEATEAIAGGDMQQRVEVTGDDEIATLSRDFNRMAKDLQEKIGELQENAESRERFVGAFAHELKTPLTSIIGYSDMLRGKTPPPERVQMCADYIFNEGKRLESLSMRLLDFMVIKNQALCLQNVYLPTLFDELRVSVTPQMIVSGIAVSWDVQPGIVAMEPSLMKDVFLNLLDNARKAIDDNGRISVEGTPEREFYVVRITDNGRGMNIEELDKIKEAFYMVDKSRSRRQGGAGLGLSICDEILACHGFTIAFESEPGLRTSVTVRMKGGGTDARAHEED